MRWMILHKTCNRKNKGLLFSIEALRGGNEENQCVENQHNALIIILNFHLVLQLLERNIYLKFAPI